VKVLFDTSVLVSAVVDSLPRHATALETFLRYTTGRHTAYCSTHALAEAYATLTALPVTRRITPDTALRLIETNFTSRLTVVPLAVDAYGAVLRRVTTLGLASGIIYDALHLHAAENAGCTRLYTYHPAHFLRLQPSGILISQP
jgi:predicted nucleic acid-binding protein